MPVVVLVVTGLLRRADKEEEMQPGERATAAEEGGGWKGGFQDLRHAGVVVCCPRVLPLPRALQSMEKAFVPCPDQTAQLFITMKYGGISKANCK